MACNCRGSSSLPRQRRVWEVVHRDGRSTTFQSEVDAVEARRSGGGVIRRTYDDSVTPAADD